MRRAGSAGVVRMANRARGEDARGRRVGADGSSPSKARRRHREGETTRERERGAREKREGREREAGVAVYGQKTTSREGGQRRYVV